MDFNSLYIKRAPFQFSHYVQVYRCKTARKKASIRVSFIQKHFASPAHKELKLSWVTPSWAKLPPDARFPQAAASVSRYRLSNLFSLAASSHSLSNKFRGGIAAGEFQCSQKACLHRLQIWLRRHRLPGGPHRSSPLPVLTVSPFVSYPRFWGSLLTKNKSHRSTSGHR